MTVVWVLVVVLMLDSQPRDFQSIAELKFSSHEACQRTRLMIIQGDWHKRYIVLPCHEEEAR